MLCVVMLNAVSERLTRPLTSLQWSRLIVSKLSDFSIYVKRRFQPTQRTQRRERNGTNVSNFRNVTKWRHYWVGQSQPLATTAYAAAKLWQTRAK